MSHGDGFSLSKRTIKAACAVALGIHFCLYVMLYPVFTMLAYFNLIDTDQGPGHAIHLLYYPVGYVEFHCPPVARFFDWLGGLYLAPFSL